MRIFFETPGDKPALGVTVPGEGADDFKNDLDLLGVEEYKETKPAAGESEETDGDLPKKTKKADEESDAVPDEDGEAEPDEEVEEESEEDADKKLKAKEDEEPEEDLVRHSYSAIKKEYPELFKKFPGLKQAFFREQEFTKLFPTIEDAKAAVGASEVYQEMRMAVITGNAEEFLGQLKTSNAEALENFAGNFLPDLRKVDKQLFIDVTSPIIKNLLRSVLVDGADAKDENIVAAAKVVHHAIFGGKYDDIGDEVKPMGRQRAPADDPDRMQLSKEKQEFYQTKFNTLRTEIWNDIEASINKDIEKGLDPTNSIRPGLRKLITEKIFSEVTKKIAGDEQHMQRMNELWRREAANGYSGKLKESIRTTYLSRAKAIIPPIRQKVRADITAQQKKEDTTKRDKLGKNAGADRSVPGPTGSNRKSAITAKEANSKRMSDMDILNS
jgi:hypothetical protein